MKVAVEATRLRQPPALSSVLKCGQALAGVAFKLIPRNLWKLSHDNNRPGETRSDLLLTCQNVFFFNVVGCYRVVRL